jgi:hypothetical protein
MSRILKRPMFRIGGSVDDGIMSMAAPRKNYQEGSPREQRIFSRAEENAKMLERFAGAGPSVTSDLGDLLVSGGLNLLSGRGAGKGTLGAIAESYRDPYAAFSKARSAEDVFKRQLKLSGATQAMASDEALEIARLKAQGEERFQKDYSPDRMYYEAYSKYTDPKSKDAFKKDITTDYPESFASFIAYIQPSAKKSGIDIIGVVPNEISGNQRIFNYDKMIAGGVYFDPRTKKLYQSDPEKNVIKELDPYSGKLIREIPKAAK